MFIYLKQRTFEFGRYGCSVSWKYSLSFNVEAPHANIRLFIIKKNLTTRRVTRSFTNDLATLRSWRAGLAQKAGQVPILLVLLFTRGVQKRSYSAIVPGTTTRPVVIALVWT